jgi:hypothetical protein
MWELVSIPPVKDAMFCILRRIIDSKIRPLEFLRWAAGKTWKFSGLTPLMWNRNKQTALHPLGMRGIVQRKAGDNTYDSEPKERQ